MAIENEEKLTLAQAAKLAPGCPHASSLWRHCRKGVKTRTGGRICLEHIRFGSRVFTSREALDRFGQRLADADAAYFADVGTAQRTSASLRTDSHQQLVEVGGLQVDQVREVRQ